MKLIKAIFTIILLVLILTIPKLILWIISGVIRILIVIKKTLGLLIKLLQEEIVPGGNN